MLNDWCDATGGDKLATNWQAHDFSFRGMPGPEAAALSGAAHLLSFGGTDSLPALDLIDAYYDGPLCKLPIAGSVPATEHSVMSAGGDADEEWTFLRLLQLYPTGIVSIVSDTWDLWNVVGPRGILSKLTNDVKKRDGKLVVRPDSGDPVKIICGDLEADFGSPQQKGVVECLWDLFGGTVERRSGCRLLDPHIGVIYGDSINHDRANDICIRLAAKKFASTNVVFGIGSYTYQYVTRDTYGLAMKATWASIDGKSCVLYKKPATDDGTKHSARGRLAVMPSMDNTVKLNVIENASYAQETGSLLRRLWCDGKFVHKQTFDDIKFRLWNQEGGVAER
jgi:nicotinamide phosphoribosyltransferase